ncbi:MAG TPA: hypothetical protein V6D21_02720 [Candidatus Obscuribacterales bacterium]
MAKLTARYLQTLKNRVVDSGDSKNWLGKDVLEIGEEIYGFVNNGVNNFPVVNILTGLTEPIFEPIKQIAEQLLALPDIGIMSGLLTLETIYGINKAYNTKKYRGQNLVDYAISIINRDIPSSDDDYYYAMGISAYNETLNIPLLNTQINSLQSKVVEVTGNIQSQAQSKIDTFESKFGIDYIQDKIAELQSLIRNQSASIAIKNQFYRLRSFVKKSMAVTSSPQSIQIPISISAYGVGGIELIVPKITPSLVDVVGIINKLASWFLSIFSIPNQILEILTHTVTSVVCKAIGSAGAEVSRYLSAGLLKSLPQLVPKVGSATGTLFGGAWATLMGYAPWIALVAGLILVALKLSDKKVKFGRFVYLFGTKLVGSPDTGFAGTYDMNEKQMRDFIIEYAKELLSEAQSTYNKLWAFNVNNDEEIALMFDLTNINNPIEISDKTLQKTTWDSLKHFIEEPF